MFGRRRFLKYSVIAAAMWSQKFAMAAGTSMRLGTVPVVSTRTAYEIYGPLMTHLQKGLGLVNIVLETPPNFKGMYQRIRENGFDLLISPPHIARLAQKRYGWHPLVMLQAEHRSVLLAQDAKGPTDLEALRGGTIAVHDNTALVVMIMMDALAKKGLQINRDFKVIETRSYESSRIAVSQGIAQAMVFRSQGFIDPKVRDHFRVLFEAGALPGYVIIAAPGTPKTQIQVLRSQLLAFGKMPEARQFLNKLGYDGMATATEEAMQRLDPYLAQTESKLK